MKQFVILLAGLLGSYALFAQKKPIDSAAYSTWYQLYNPYLTADGRYVCYNLTNKATRSFSINLVSADGKWSKAIPGAMIGELAGNDAYYLIKRSDTLNFIQLGTDKEELFKAITYCIPETGGKNLLFFQDAASKNDLSFKTLNNKKISHVNNVGVINSYHYFPAVNAVLLKTESDSAGRSDLKLVNLPGLQVTTILNEQLIKFIVEDTLNNQVAVITDAAILNYKIQSGVLKKIVTKIPEGYQFSYPLRFSRNGERLFLVCSREDKQHKKALADVNIWTYKDAPDEYSLINYRANTVTVSLNLKDGELTVLNSAPGSRIDLLNAANDALAVESQDTFSADHAPAFQTSLISNVDGRQLFSCRYGLSMSPAAKYAVYTDKKNFYAYEVSTGITRNLTEGIWENWGVNENGDYDFWVYNSGIIGWGEDDETVYLCDQYDIWKLDLTGKERAFCLTNGYGKKNKIIFSVIDDMVNLHSGKPHLINADKKISFVAFDTNNKQNGFYYKRNTVENGDPIKLLMEDATYWVPTVPLSFPGLTSDFRKPLKAGNAEVYLVAHSTARESPNLFTTRDLKHFTALTHNYPERNYNWYTTELVTWPNSKGVKLQGVLYKPENFDSTKKYPLIFYHYRKASANLNAYIIPQQYPGCIIDIPTYVSNGYLVFTPDIYFTKGETGESALDALVSAAEKLSERPYVDSTKLGIQGCSFSGFTTNYIVTHTGKFTAAVSASGLSDLVSGYNSINAGEVKQWQFEDGGPYQMGAKLWDDPQAYIRNSPVFSVPALTTPLLLMHTTKDFTVPLANAMEFYLAGKRLGKKIWLLEYGNNNSHVVRGKEGSDFNTRMLQFFNYYLKGNLPPRWLTEGRPAGMKESDPALELDSSGRVP